ncbi:MAG: DUF3667 domain-containing protein [Flavobacteriales bacterium]|nr:DUF3667 domain-containing protein [Flavobacteriales bacterium]
MAEDNYCARCGQENHTHKLPLRHFIVEFLAGTFNFDTKLLRTLRDLFVPPGLVVRNYNQNKRARYVPPLRLYLFTSVVFFIVLSILPEHERPVAPEGNERNGLKFTAGSDTIDSELMDLAERGALTDAAIDSVLMANGDDQPSDFERRLVRTAMEQNLGGDKRAQFDQRFMGNISKLMFVLLPLFALLLYLLNWRARGFFTEHLVFAFYFHTVVFALLLLRLLVNEASYAAVGITTDYTTLIPLLSLVYLPWAMRTVYGRPWWRTIIKTLLIVVVYSIVLGMALVGAAILTAIV